MMSIGKLVIHVREKEKIKVHIYMSQLLVLGKLESGGGPIFKVVLEC